MRIASEGSEINLQRAGQSSAPGFGPEALFLSCLLGRAANAVALGLDAPGRLVSHPRRDLGDTLVRVDHLPQVVPHEIALNRHKVLHGAAADKPERDSGSLPGPRSASAKRNDVSIGRDRSDRGRQSRCQVLKPVRL
jgi:hypothetical protein